MNYQPRHRPGRASPADYLKFLIDMSTRIGCTPEDVAREVDAAFDDIEILRGGGTLSTEQAARIAAALQAGFITAADLPVGGRS
jgi:hypothetical protein